MTPLGPDDDKRDLIWSVLACIMFWAIVIIAILIVTEARGAEVKLAWNANPTTDQVSEYRLYKLPAKTLIAKTVGLTATITAEPGDIVAVAAWNGIESELSASVTIPHPDATRLMVQRSTDMKTWTDIAEYYDPKRPIVFYRIRIEPRP